MGLKKDYYILVHHLKFHLEKFSKTTQGTIFTTLLGDSDKTYGFGYKYTNV